MRFWTEAAAPSVEFQAELTPGPDPVVMLTDSSQHIEMMLTLDEVNSLLAALVPLAEQALHNQVAEALDEL